MPFQNEPYVRGLFNVSGFRLPVILVSPWSKPHFVWHTPTDYTSILRLIETRFNVHRFEPSRPRVRQISPIPTNGPFDFSSPQMLQVPPLPTQPTNGTCNYQLEGSSGLAQRVVDDLLSLGDDGVEMRFVLEALGVDFVDVFRAGRPSGKPAALGHDLQAADRQPRCPARVSAWR